WAPSVPLGARKGDMVRGRKKPGAPPSRVLNAHIWLTQPRARSWFQPPVPITDDNSVGGIGGAVVIASQKARSASTRFSGGLPAIRAELMAPIEMPATQSGCNPASAKAWYTPA